MVDRSGEFTWDGNTPTCAKGCGILHRGGLIHDSVNFEVCNM